MGEFECTDWGGERARWPSTHWSWLYALQGPEGEQCESALERLLKLYWKPIYCWLRSHGYNDADALDLVHDFFVFWLLGGKAEQADHSRGRFRTFLLTSLKNFIKNLKRNKAAGGRQPSKPILSLDQFDTTDVGIEPFDTETPEDSFNRAWARELISRVLDLFKEDCMKIRKKIRYELFRRRIIEPELEGAPKPRIKELAKEVGASPKQVSNHLVRARIKFQGLLKAEIRNYACSDEEIASEMNDLFRVFA